MPVLLVLCVSGRGCPMARRGRLIPLPRRRKGFVVWIYCWVIRNFMGSCRGLVRVSGPCTSVCCESHMALPPPSKKIIFSFSFSFSVSLLLLYLGYSRGYFFLLLSSVWAFGCTSFHHHPDFLCYLVHTQGFTDSFRFAGRSCFCIAVIILHLFFSLLPFSWLVIVFCIAFLSSLLSTLLSRHLFLCFVPLSFFLLCYNTHRRHRHYRSICLCLSIRSPFS